MSGNTNFPTALDDNTSLGDVVDNVTAVVASHHNNPKEAIKAMQAKIGIYNTSAPTSLDARLGHPTFGHDHNGASGHGLKIAASAIVGQLGATQLSEPLHIAQMFLVGTAIVGSKVTHPVVLGRTMQLLSIQGGLRKGPSGATAAFSILIGPSHTYGASVGFRPIFPPGATAYRSAATPNVITYPSGAVITLDTQAVGSNEPGFDGSFTLFFRD